MLRRALFSAWVIALLVVLQPQRVEADPVMVAPFVVVAVGDTFTIQVSIADALDLESFQFDLAFDPLIVQAFDVGVTPGAALPSDWFFTSPGFVDNAGGQILGVSAFGSAFSGGGVIAEIQFTALMAGVSPLTLSNAFLNLSDQGFGVANGQITVTGAATVPEPTTLALLAIGLLGFGARRSATRAWRIAA